MIPCLVIPFLNRRDLLARCIQSIDYPVGELMVINNGARESLHEMMLPTSIITYQEVVRADNLGVAGSWNLGLNHAFNNCGYEYVVFCGNDIQWSPGDLQKFAEAFDPEADFMSGNWAFSTFAITKKGFGKLGWFDENYYPAYLEDGDFWRRVQLSSAKCVSVDTHAIHGEAPHWGSATINSDARLAQEVRHGHERNWIYHMKKWGGRREGNTERFKTPFGAPSEPIWYWELSDQRRQQPHFRKNG